MSHRQALQDQDLDAPKPGHADPKYSAAWKVLCAKNGVPEAAFERVGGSTKDLHDQRKTMRRAINKVAADATAFVHRNAYFNIFTDGFWLKEEDRQATFDWVAGMYDSSSMQSLWSGYYYQNYPNSAYTNWQNGYFGTNYAQLQQVKLTWDPQNFFQFEQSIELP